MKGIDIVIAILIIIFVSYFFRRYSNLKRENFGGRGGGHGLGIHRGGGYIGRGGYYGGRHYGGIGRGRGYWGYPLGGLGLGLGYAGNYYDNNYPYYYDYPYYDNRPIIIVKEEKKEDEKPWFYWLFGN